MHGLNLLHNFFIIIFFQIISYNFTRKKDLKIRVDGKKIHIFKKNELQDIPIFKSKYSIYHLKFSKKFRF